MDLEKDESPYNEGAPKPQLSTVTQRLCLISNKSFQITPWQEGSHGCGDQKEQSALLGTFTLIQVPTGHKHTQSTTPEPTLDPQRLALDS